MPDPVYFIDYAIPLVPISPLCQKPPYVPTTPSLFMFMGHAYKLFGFSISYTALNNPLSIVYLPICTS